MLLTFHDSKVLAWQAVGEALRKSGWQIVSVAVVHSENEKDFAKIDKKAIAVDAVFECMHAGRRRKVVARGALNNNSARNVLAMAGAVAAYVNGAVRPLSWLYSNRARRLGVKKLTID